jgi:hypothetical protein
MTPDFTPPERCSMSEIPRVALLAQVAQALQVLGFDIDLLLTHLTGDIEGVRVELPPDLTRGQTQGFTYVIDAVYERDWWPQEVPRDDERD